MKKSFVIAIVLVLGVIFSVAMAAPSSYKSPESNNEYMQVKNTGASALGKGAPVVLEAAEVVDTTQAEVGVQGTTDTTAVIVGVATETIEVGAVGTIITHGFGEVLVDEAVAADANLGASTTSGEADDNNTNAQSLFAVAMELASARGLVYSYIHCK